MVHESIEPSELWNRMPTHVHYRSLPIAIKAVSRLPEIQKKHEGVCKGRAQGQNIKKESPGR